LVWNFVNVTPDYILLPHVIILTLELNFLPYFVRCVCAIKTWEMPLTPAKCYACMSPPCPLETSSDD